MPPTDVDSDSNGTGPCKASTATAGKATAVPSPVPARFGVLPMTLRVQREIQQGRKLSPASTDFVYEVVIFVEAYISQWTRKAIRENGALQESRQATCGVGQRSILGIADNFFMIVGAS